MGLHTTSPAIGSLLLRRRGEFSARHAPLWPSAELLGKWNYRAGYSEPSGWWTWGVPAILLHIQCNREGVAVAKVLTGTAEVGWLDAEQLQWIT